MYTLSARVTTILEKRKDRLKGGETSKDIRKQREYIGTLINVVLLPSYVTNSHALERTDTWKFHSPSSVATILRA
jgi:hypothetical protein